MVVVGFGNYTRNYILPTLTEGETLGLLPPDTRFLFLDIFDMSQEEALRISAAACRVPEDSLKGRVFYGNLKAANFGLRRTMAVDWRATDWRTAETRGNDRFVVLFASPGDTYEDGLEDFVARLTPGHHTATDRIRALKAMFDIIFGFEKPFGRNKASCGELLGSLYDIAGEENTAGVDHYGGKVFEDFILELILNNDEFASLLCGEYLTSMVLTHHEPRGLDGRWFHVEGPEGKPGCGGQGRDWLQNHPLRYVRKIVAAALRRMYPGLSVADMELFELAAVQSLMAPKHALWGQYDGYLREPNVKPGSLSQMWLAVETGIAPVDADPHLLDVDVRDIAVDLRRHWAGTKLVIETGKRMPGKHGELRLVGRDGVVRVFDFQQVFEDVEPGSNLSVIVDLANGDVGRFEKRRIQEAQWGFVDPILAGWESNPGSRLIYPPGSGRPPAASVIDFADEQPGDEVKEVRLA